MVYQYIREERMEKSNPMLLKLGTAQNHGNGSSVREIYFHIWISFLVFINYAMLENLLLFPV